MTKKQRRKREKDLRHDQFAPAISKGLTLGTMEGVSKREALERHPVKSVPGGAQVVSHMRDADKRMLTKDGRAQFAPFVARDSTDAVWSDGVTDRPQMDYSATYTKAGMGLLREGRQCLRCQEPQPIPFPVACDLCGYAMKDRQIMDIAMEFEGERHLGPSRPIAEYLEEIELRKEKRRFIKKARDGGGLRRRIPKAWLKEAHLFDGT